MLVKVNKNRIFAQRAVQVFFLQLKRFSTKKSYATIPRKSSFSIEDSFAVTNYYHDFITFKVKKVNRNFKVIHYVAKI